MKRKLFNAALFGAVLIAAPVSTFVSCADYDADIKNVNDQVAALQQVVNDKEAAIKTQIAALEAKDAELAAADKALEQKLADCQANCAAELAKCKADCAAARAELQKAIDDLKAALAAAEKKHGDDVASLMQKDGELQKGIDGAVARLDAAEKQLKDLAATDADLQKQIDALRTDLNKVQKDLTDNVTRLDGRIDALDKALKDAKAELEGKIAANTTEINTLKGKLEQEIKDRKSADDALDAQIKAAVERITKNEGDIKTLKADLAALTERVGKVEGEVAKNTKAIVDLAVRVVDLEDQLAAAQEVLDGVLDSIDKLQKEDVRLWAAINNIYNAEAGTGVLIDKYNDALAKAQQYANAAQAAAEAYARTQDEAVKSTLRAEMATMKSELEGKITAVKNELADFKAEVARVYATKAELAATKDEITRAYQAADALLDEKIDNLESTLRTLVATVAEQLSAEVKGFVLEPASYYEGIQAIEGTSYEYYKWTLGEKGYAVKGDKVNTYCPSVTAYYHINPSAAVLSKDVAQYGYAVLDRENRAGKNTDLKPVITKVDQAEGMLEVTMSLTNPAANKTPKGHQDPSEVTVMALQYTNPAAKAENQVVTSDYAVLYLNPLVDVSLVDRVDGHSIADLTVPGQMAEQDYVPYTETYDIEAQIATEFGDEKATTTLPAGFEYRYTVIDGDTEYFQHAADFTVADGVAVPQMPGGKPATIACVGKSATFRIDVMHGEEIVEVGYYTLTIVGEALIETSNPTVTDAKYTIDCEEEGAVALKATLSEENVWNKIVEVTGEDLATVKTKYALSKLTDGNVAQFAEYTSTENNVYYRGTKGVGTITEKDGELVWEVLYADPAIDALTTLTKETKNITTYVRVRSLDAVSKDTYNEFYLPVVWAPKHIEMWGDADYDYEFEPLAWTYTRVSNQWQANKLTREAAELRLYADLTNDAVFEYNLSKAIDYKSIKVEFVNKGKFEKEASFIKEGTGRFRFIEHPVEDARFVDVVAEDGVTETYELFTKEEGRELWAAKGKAMDAKIATITDEGKITLVHNATTNLLLNEYKKNELNYGETLCARVGYEVETCREGLAVKVVTGDFDVRFIKPLEVLADDIVIIDADGVAGHINVSELLAENIVAFNDYSFFAHPEYWDVFGASVSYFVGEATTPDSWATNYDAAADDFTKTLGDHAVKVNFEVSENGDVIYNNNTAVVSDFTVKVPVTVTYVWGSTTTYVNLVVKKTAGNSNRK